MEFASKFVGMGFVVELVVMAEVVMVVMGIVRAVMLEQRGSVVAAVLEKRIRVERLGKEMVMMLIVLLVGVGVEFVNFAREGCFAEKAVRVDEVKFEDLQV
jgi:hypothetical protein